ncbi:MAG: chorismate synthase [Bacteroidales bacterium]|jgi:chorismate synthase|nr:chorismate synthase [Bacteroidales bacterium]
MNSFGRNFRVSIFGESHGIQIGVMIDGCPAGIELSETDLLSDIGRRRSGRVGTTPRIEADEPHIVSGVFQGKTTGAPIVILCSNTNTKSGDYANLWKQPRPSHADFTGKQKFHAYNDPRGGGHFSGRITWGMVVAGVIAKKIIAPLHIAAHISEVGGSTDIREAVEKAVAEKNSIGGIVSCTCSNVPIGLGEPFFDSVESMISHIIFAIPAVKAIEFGAGFTAAAMTGSQHNDRIIDAHGKTDTNNAGGINGGISNGNDIYFRVAVKPTASIGIAQNTFNFETNSITPLIIAGRHDACIALRMPVIVEAAAAIALADFSSLYS